MHGAAGGGGQQGASLAYRTPRGTTICIEELRLRRRALGVVAPVCIAIACARESAGHARVRTRMYVYM